MYECTRRAAPRGENPKTSTTMAQFVTERYSASCVAARYTYPLSSIGKLKLSQQPSSTERISSESNCTAEYPLLISSFEHDNILAACVQIKHPPICELARDWGLLAYSPEPPGIVLRPAIVAAGWSPNARVRRRSR